jgi:GTP-binding protein LepA
MIGAVNKIDLAPERALRVARDLAELLETAPDEILQISGKTGEGVAMLLEKIVREVPPPAHGSRTGSGRALIFDSLYDDHKGILAYVRVMEGEYRAGDDVRFGATGSVVKLKETGSFSPERVSVPALLPGMIGYLATGFKEARQVLIGDTVLKGHGEALPGYREIAPVVFISFYPDGSTDFDMLKRAFERLRLTDAAISFEPDANEALGRGQAHGHLLQFQSQSY